MQVVATTAGGIPYLGPRFVLLFKAQQPRAVDELDFSASMQLLEPDERQWLREAISLSNPSHPWIERLN
jgi:hypothetical protein